MYGLTRGTVTLIGAACAGLLLWLASQVNADSLGGYWAFLGLAAAAGLTMAFSQLLGGWTKWGWPQVSGSVFLLGFLPGLVAGGLVLLAAQPDSGAWGTGWASDVGAGGLAEDMTAVVPAIAFAVGLLFGFTFDTTGRRVREADVVVDERADVRRPGWIGTEAPDAAAADEPVTAERAAAARPVVTERSRDETSAPVAVGAGARPQSDGHAPDAEAEPRRRRLFTFHRS